MKIDTAYTRKEIIEIIENIPASPSNSSWRNTRCRLIITGSFLLHIHGLVDKFNDVDILVVDADKEFWSELFSHDYEWDIRQYDGYRSIKVVFKDITYNFIEDDLYNERQTLYANYDSDIEFDTLPHALKAKAKLNREQDKTTLEDIRKRIEQFTNPFQL